MKKSKFEWAVVERVKSLREKKQLSQADVALMLGLSSGFIGQIESVNSPSKYNLDHLNRLALELECSPKDFIPEKAVVESGKGKK